MVQINNRWAVLFHKMQDQDYEWVMSEEIIRIQVRSDLLNFPTAPLYLGATKPGEKTVWPQSRRMTPKNNPVSGERSLKCVRDKYLTEAQDIYPGPCVPVTRYLEEVANPLQVMSLQVTLRLLPLVLVDPALRLLEAGPLPKSGIVRRSPERQALVYGHKPGLKHVCD
jgi:hypothetical protein